MARGVVIVAQGILDEAGKPGCDARLSMIDHVAAGDVEGDGLVRVRSIVERREQEVADIAAGIERVFKERTGDQANRGNAGEDQTSDMSHRMHPWLLSRCRYRQSCVDNMRTKKSPAQYRGSEFIIERLTASARASDLPVARRNRPQ